MMLMSNHALLPPPENSATVNSTSNNKTQGMSEPAPQTRGTPCQHHRESTRTSRLRAKTGLEHVRRGASRDVAYFVATRSERKRGQAALRHVRDHERLLTAVNHVHAEGTGTVEGSQRDCDCSHLERERAGKHRDGGWGVYAAGSPVGRDRRVQALGSRLLLFCRCCRQLLRVSSEQAGGRWRMEEWRHPAAPTRACVRATFAVTHTFCKRELERAGPAYICQQRLWKVHKRFHAIGRQEQFVMHGPSMCSMVDLQ